MASPQLLGVALPSTVSASSTSTGTTCNTSQETAGTNAEQEIWETCVDATSMVVEDAPPSFSSSSTPSLLVFPGHTEDRATADRPPSSGLIASVFNATNVLVGIGILSMPFAFRLVGWIGGGVLLTSFSLVTNYTARILVKCLDYTGKCEISDSEHVHVRACGSGVNDAFEESSPLLGDKERSSDHVNTTASPRCNQERLQTYADIGQAAFHRKGRLFISVLFTLELFAAAVALVMLIADCLHELVPHVSLLTWKFVAFVVVTPSLWFRNLKYLSYGSLLGIVTIVNLLVVILYEGLRHETRPGSLWNPEMTRWGPETWAHVPLAFGLVMAGFSGHAVFPNIYRDMQTPQKYCQVVHTAYGIAIILYATMSVVGYLMFGHFTKDEITKNLRMEAGSPLLGTVTIWLVAVNPMTKYALTLQPICTTLELMLLNRQNHQRQSTRWSDTTTDDTSIPLVNPSLSDVRICSILPFPVVRLLWRTLLSASVFLVAVVVPGFDRIMSLLGSLFSFVVSVVFPLMCYLKLYGATMPWWKQVANVLLLVASACLAAVGTVWSFLPLTVEGAS